MSTRRLKILYIITSLRPGGAERIVTDLAIRMSKRGHTVDILIFDDTPSHLSDELEMAGITVLSYGSGYLQMWNPVNILKIRKLIKTNGYDIIHSHNTSAQFFVALAKKKGKSHYLTTEHNTHNRRRNLYGFKNIDRWLYRKYDSVICVGENVKTNLINYLGVKDISKFLLIYNGIDLERFSFSHCEFIEKTETGKIILMVAGFRKQKDHATAIKAMTQLDDNYVLWLAGEGETKKDCESLVAKLNLDHRVKFLGNIADISKIMKAADIILMSSHFEGISLAVVEGMASRKPVIASDVEGLREIVKKYGLLFEHQNPFDLARKIRMAAVDKSLYTEISIACKERSRDYDIEKTVSKHEELYLRLSEK